MKPNLDEALRYLGAQDAPENLRKQTAETAEALASSLQPRYTYKVYDLTFREEGIELLGSGVVLTGGSAQVMLAECVQAALLACTLGSSFDLRLTALQARDMARAVVYDACGSAFVEAGCDAAAKELSDRFPERYLTDRFSPGYGDLPLSLQPAICTALDTPRRLGLHVTGSLLLNPVKSVTAVIGLSGQPQKARVRGCAYCRMRDTCALRKGGKSCAI